jgi:polyhydroxybutyrate depolymerase
MTSHRNGLARRTIAVGGIARTYWIAAGSRPNAPLLIVLHGLGMSATVIAKWTRLDTRGPAAGFATVFPEGIAQMWDDTGRGRRDGVNDDAFAQALVPRLADDAIADPRAVFLIGLSNGAFFAERLARAGILTPRGVVLVAGTAREASRQANPRPKLPIALLCFAGTADRSVPYAGGRASGPFGWLTRRRVRRSLLDPTGREAVGAEALAQEWADANGIPATPAATAVLGTELPVRRLSWTAPARLPVVLYRIEGGAHGWPGAPQYLPARLIGRIPSDLDASGILLSFAREILEAGPGW